MHSSDSIYEQKIENRSALILEVESEKPYLRRRKEYVPLRTLTNAQEEINRILMREPTLFLSDSSAIDLNQTKIVLNKISHTLNNLKEKTILLINAHTKSEGSSQYNLKLSQLRADTLKEYFAQRTQLVHISSIGYGKEISSKNHIEIVLQRVKDD